MRSLLVALLIACVAQSAHALKAAEKKGAKARPAPTEKAPDPGKAAPSKNRRLPFHGKVSAVDAAGKSFNLKGVLKDRVFLVTEQTKILNREKAPVKSTDLAVGEVVTGSASKAGDVWTAVTVYVGGKNPKTVATKQAGATPAPVAAEE